MLGMALTLFEAAQMLTVAISQHIRENPNFTESIFCEFHCLYKKNQVEKSSGEIKKSRHCLDNWRRIILQSCAGNRPSLRRIWLNQFSVASRTPSFRTVWKK